PNRKIIKALRQTRFMKKKQPQRHYRKKLRQAAEKRLHSFLRNSGSQNPIAASFAGSEFLAVPSFYYLLRA
ncbi:MAG TPA: hypothetical protein PKN29_14285, partial [Candidatus Ozemobacteraceae bacterium]|nr:hypothetical protein [Candidatus Ozemobacteraceae bacterium]